MTGAYLCFEDEAGGEPDTAAEPDLGPPRPDPDREGQRHAAPDAYPSAGVIAARLGKRTRWFHRLRVHRPGRKTERRSLSERDYIGLLDATHRQLQAPIILIWDRLNTHVSRMMRDMIAARDWLTVVLLPAYAPGLNPVERAWAHLKHGLANLAAGTLDRLTALIRSRLKRLQYRPDLLDGFIAGTGLILDLPPP